MAGKRIRDYFTTANWRAFMALGHDVVMAGLSVWLSFFLRLGDDIYLVPADLMYFYVLLVMVVTLFVVVLTGSFRGLWRYVSVGDGLRIARSVTLIIIIHTTLVFLLTRLEAYPRSTPFINWFVLGALLGGPRILYRLYRDRTFAGILSPVDQRKIPALIIGAGDNAEVFIREMARDKSAAYRVVGALTGRATRVGMQLHGIKVMGLIDDLTPIAQKLKQRGIHVEKLIITNELEGEKLSKLLEQADQLGLSVSRSPSLGQLNAAVSAERQIRPVQIEDLLGRPQTALNKEQMQKFLQNARVIVTGAGGSIGSELVRQICGFNPKALLLIDHSEHALYLIDMEVAVNYPTVAHEAKLCDVRDEELVRQLFKNFKPDVVFHAAAYKHVPIVELNPLEGMLTNIIGTKNITEAARDAGAKAMVQISTDKAVNPTNVMGASKRLAEAYCQALDLVTRAEDECAYITVRFGNVLGSSGSVVPLFQKQLEKGGPITITHPEIKRYFMTIKEAVSLVLEAAWHGAKANEAAGKIYILDMGEPLKIIDLAKQMVRLAGLKPNRDIEIKITGLRPGEKLKEELFHESEKVVPTTHEGLLLASPRTLDYKKLKAEVEKLEKLLRHRKTDAAVEQLKELVPEYEIKKD